ncbi:MAG: homoserine dehydrogenase [Phycisphaerales bacterium]|nr:homoserine dehydrogenase [Phycisphaerales bacterium]
MANATADRIVPQDDAESACARRGSLAERRVLREIRIALLGVGNVGQAVARGCIEWATAFAERGFVLRPILGLVRDPQRARGELPTGLHLVGESQKLVAERVDVVVEALGGVEPAFELVRAYLQRGVPVVTANKTLLAEHGAVLRQVAQQQHVPLRVEASVVAGVPFVGTHAARPLAARVERVTGIVNGTSNFILTTMQRDGASFEAALARAQQLGYAEPDPAKDVRGMDAAEKLVVLLRELGRAEVPLAALMPVGIDTLGPEDFADAAALGGRIKPVISAEFTEGTLRAYVGPAFVTGSHPLARVEGAENGIVLAGRAIGRLFYAGPGAGPEITAATLLDDVIEVFANGGAASEAAGGAAPVPRLAALQARYFVTCVAVNAVSALDVAVRVQGAGATYVRQIPMASGRVRVVALVPAKSQSEVEALSVRLSTDSVGVRTYPVVEE